MTRALLLAGVVGVAGVAGVAACDERPLARPAPSPASSSGSATAAPVPAEAFPAPTIRITGCAMGGASESTSLASALGHVPYCWLRDDGSVAIELAVAGWQPGADALTVDGAPVIVGPDGTGTQPVDLDPTLLAAPVVAAIGDGSGVPARTVPIELRRGDAVVATGAAEIRIGRAATRRTRALLAGVARGIPLPRAEAGGGPPVDPRSLVYVPSVAWARMVTTGAPRRSARSGGSRSRPTSRRGSKGRVGRTGPPAAPRSARSRCRAGSSTSRSSCTTPPPAPRSRAGRSRTGTRPAR